MEAVRISQNFPASRFECNDERISKKDISAAEKALRQAQEAFKGAAEQIGVKNEEDVQQLVDEVRYG